MTSCCSSNITNPKVISSGSEPPSPGLLTYDYQRPLFATQNLTVPSLFRPHLSHHQTRRLIRTTTSTRRHLYNNEEDENDIQNQTSSTTSIAASTSLVDKITGDVAIGIASTFCVAPFLTIVDKAIVQRAAGTHTLLTSGFETMTTIVKNPVQYAKSPIFLYMWAVYGTTYSTANSLKTIMEHNNVSEQRRRNISSSTTTRKPRSNQQLLSNSGASSSSASIVTFLGTSIVNSGGSLLKDRAYAQMFSAGNNATNGVTSFPKISYGLWMTRDFLVIGSGFVLPDIVSKQLHERHQESMNLATCKQVSQVTLPIITQFIAGPLQLLGLDFYNRPLSGLSTRAAFIERSTFLLNGYTSVVAARIARIIPGYSIGGVLNTSLRDKYRTYLKDKAEVQHQLKKRREEPYIPYFNYHHTTTTAVMTH